MKEQLVKKDDGWELVDSNGNVVESGSYPLRQDSEFIEMAAESLENWNYHQLPYEVKDQRDR